MPLKCRIEYTAIIVIVAAVVVVAAFFKFYSNLRYYILAHNMKIDSIRVEGCKRGSS